MTIELFSEAALACDIPQKGLRRGDVATVVEKLPGTAASRGAEGYVLEVFNAIGETIAVVIVVVEDAVQWRQARRSLDGPDRH